MSRFVLSLCLLAICLPAALGLGACKTRLWDIPDGYVGQAPIVPGGTPDLIMLPDGNFDLSMPPDLVLADLYVPPDLTPPPDLVLPFVCRNVYVVDSNGMFSSFDTDKLLFNDIKKLDCPDTGSPYSMAVGRDGFAYVLYSDGNIFRVNIMSAACSATVFVPDQQGFNTFGMGFAADMPGGASETLFIGNGTSLAAIDFPALTVRPISGLAGQPELTGTLDAQLWGFFPGTQSFLAQIDKQSGMTSNTINLPQLAGTPSAWAFAFWGGSFWLFLKNGGDPSTNVYQVDRLSGKETTAIPNTGRSIVGAGVSSCAPIGMDQ